MRVSLFLWVSMAVSLQLAAFDTNGQSIDEIEVSLEFKGAKLSDVLTKIQNETKINFIYTPDQVDAIVNVTLPRQRRTVKDLLEAVLSETLLTYKEIDGTVVLFKKKTSELQGLAEPNPLRREEIIVTGKVTDMKTGEPLPAVNVVVKGSANGTSTDKNGIYSLSVENENDILVFSFIGFKSYEIAVGGLSRIDVALESDVQELKEVIVNAGYYDVTEEKRTGSIARIDSDVISKQPVTNALSAMQGRMPGVYIQQNSGIPGSGFKVQVRGINSLNNGNDPLYVIDGVPFISQTQSNNIISGRIFPGGISPLVSINPNDIESIDVLKDADATAIYGSRGANGVVLITTKRGDTGKTKIDLNVFSGVSQVPKSLDLLSTKEYLAMRHEAYRNTGTTPSPSQYDLTKWDTTRHTNWQKKLIGGNAEFIKAQATISGGLGNEATYLISGAAQKQTTVFPGDNDAKMYSLHFSINNENRETKLKSRLTSSFVANNSNLPGIDLTQTALTLAPNAPRLYDENGDINWENSTWDNPLAFLLQRIDTKSRNLITNLILSYQILPNLEVKTSIGYNYINTRDKQTTPNTVNRPAWGTTPANSVLYINNANSESIIVEPQITWNTELLPEFKLTTLLGGTYLLQTSQVLSERYNGFSSNALINDPRSSFSTEITSSDDNVYKYVAGFGRINLEFKDRYIINITGRRDGSSRFGPGKKFANLGSIGAGWIFTRESILQDNSILSFGKLRTSYGITGNDQIGNYQYLDTHFSNSPYNGNGTLLPSRLFNPYYAWETNNKFEAAVDLGLVDDRIYLTVAYFNNRSSNQLVNSALSATTGYSSVLSNLPATVENKGWEFQLNTTNVSKHEIRWTTSFNISFPRNRLVAFPNLETSSYSQIYEEGKSLSLRWAYKSKGVNSGTGLYEFEDLNGDGAVNFEDRLFTTEIVQKFYGGLSNTFSFKGISLDIFFQFVKKNSTLPTVLFNTPGGRGNQLKSTLENPWRELGDNASVQQVSVSGAAYDAYDRHTGSNAVITDASYIRLQNVSISYTLPESVTKQIKVRTYLQGQNLLLFTNYKGLDPETSIQSLPLLRTITAGLNITL